MNVLDGEETAYKVSFLQTRCSTSTTGLQDECRASSLEKPRDVVQGLKPRDPPGFVRLSLHSDVRLARPMILRSKRWNSESFRRKPVRRRLVRANTWHGSEGVSGASPCILHKGVPSLCGATRRSSRPRNLPKRHRIFSRSVPRLGGPSHRLRIEFHSSLSYSALFSHVWNATSAGSHQVLFDAALSAPLYPDLFIRFPPLVSAHQALPAARQGRRFGKGNCG